MKHKKWSKDITKIVNKIFYECLAWYEDEGEYQPTQKEAWEKSAKAMQSLLAKSYQEGYHDAVQEDLDNGKIVTDRTEEILNDYTSWLCKHRYTDADVYAEKPTAVEWFLKERPDLLTPKDKKA